MFPFAGFGVFPIATRVRFFVPVNMRGGLFPFGGVGCPMDLRVRFFVPASMGRVLVSFFLVCGLLNGFIGTIFRTREYEEMLGSLEVGCGVGKKTVDTKKLYPLFIKVYCLVTV